MTLNPSQNGHIRSAMRRFFNGDVHTSRELLREHVESAPHDPLGYAMSAAVPFYHFVADRMHTQHGNSIRRIIVGKGLGVSPELQNEISLNLQRAHSIALNNLAANPRDENATFTLCVTEGVNRDLMALVFKRWLLSFRHAQSATRHATQLLNINPKAYDAYFVIGFSEYLVQEIPIIFRPFARIPGIVGETRRAIQFLEAAANGGEYFREFASQILVTVYEDSGRRADSLRVMARLVEQFPGNRSYQAELSKLRGVVSSPAQHS